MRHERLKPPKLFVYFRITQIIFTLIFLVTFKSRYCAVHNRGEVLCRGSRVVVGDHHVNGDNNVDQPQGLLCCHPSDCLRLGEVAQRATVAGQRAAVALTSQETGPYEHMSRAE